VAGPGDLYYARPMPMSPRRLLPTGLVPVALLLLVAGCARPTPAPSTAAERVESRGMGLAIAALPEPFEVSINDGERLELTAPEARLTIAIGPERVAGINLVDEIESRKKWFEAAQGGGYFGNRELMTPIGTAFTARGTYEQPGGAVEETWVYAIHPSANRLLTLTYTYPTGQSQDRVQELVAVLGEIEGIGFPGGFEGDAEAEAGEG
jgi:hypothetical protein